MAEGRRRSGPPARQDWLLGGLVALVQGVEKQGVRLGVPVTLSVGGFLVSGFVVTGREYFEEFSRIIAEGLPDAFGDEGKKEIAASFEKFGSRYEVAEDNIQEIIARGDYSFVHLRDAVFLHPAGDPIPSNVGILWRTKLEAVDGFTLGTVRPVPADGPEPDE